MDKTKDLLIIIHEQEKSPLSLCVKCACALLFGTAVIVSEYKLVEVKGKFSGLF